MIGLGIEMRSVMSATVAEMAHGERTPIGVMTWLAVDDGADVKVTLRHKAAPMHLVMAAYAAAGEAEDAIRRDGGDHAHQLAALTVARHALKQAME